MKNVRVNLLATILLGIVVFTLLSAAQAQTEYSYVRINVPNGSQTIARGINAHGDILGSYVDADGVGHDFLLHDGVFSNLDYPVDAAGGARAINARGDIVGGFGDADGGHGFLLHEGQFAKIDFPGASSTNAFGINNSGDITGQYTIAFGQVRGFLLSNGKFHTVFLAEGTNAGVRGSQDNGRVMVGDVVLKSDGSVHGYLRNRPNDVELIDPTGTVFPCAHARGINERGDVVGAFSIVNNVDECNSRPPAHGFVERNGAYDIIDPPGSHDTFAFGINDDGVVVGVVTDKNGNIHGFKATPKK